MKQPVGPKEGLIRGLREQQATRTEAGVKTTQPPRSKADLVIQGAKGGRPKKNDDKPLWQQQLQASKAGKSQRNRGRYK